MSEHDVENRRVSTVIPGTTWGGLDRLREQRGYATIAEAVRVIITEAVEAHDESITGAIRLGASPLDVFGMAAD